MISAADTALSKCHFAAGSQGVPSCPYPEVASVSIRPTREEFGVRIEVNVFVDGSGTVHVTGGFQTEVLAILATGANRS
jgi:hypothetical protein